MLFQMLIYTIVSGNILTFGPNLALEPFLILPQESLLGRQPCLSLLQLRFQLIALFCCLRDPLLGRLDIGQCTFV